MYEFLKKSALAIGLATVCFNAISQGLPSDKTIRIIVPYK